VIHRRRRSNFADRLLKFPDLVFSDGAERSRRGAWREYFLERIGDCFDGRIVLEIGCNDATLLCRLAARHPTTGFIGIDWKCRALHAAAERATAAELRNVALLHGRAQDLCGMFGDGELDDIWIFHPDPCDKPHELKNRLLNEPFLADVHRVLRDGDATLTLKTDHREYYDSVMTLLQRAEVSRRFTLAASSPDYWNDATARANSAQRCFSGETSCFERRFRRKRQPIHYLELRKVPRPDVPVGLIFVLGAGQKVRPPLVETKNSPIGGAGASP
jgi:tRNA G46 methylase TrmB